MYYNKETGKYDLMRQLKDMDDARKRLQPIPPKMTFTYNPNPPENLYKMPKEILDFFFHNGTVVSEKYLFYPFWIEVIDKEQGHVKVHRLGEDIPEELKEAVTNQRELK